MGIFKFNKYVIRKLDNAMAEKYLTPEHFGLIFLAEK